ncbi:C4-dicarboxylate transporter [Leptospira perolatii]|uniref:C4-dicarboxylate transporter n=1 Tax=Leptospira perolatii TaxID=2023191 RepID=A0A2M9ZRK2_9LEPT|nr:dicarboxylate/amino acid:cation symporter [Leptospira perolatii]PJZ71031.1 C4-dicarboxylate transporter [Leptospira perolatii]PJZ74563.1 C4-dicarboxylate transporter [Leptospira perolatii]
MPVFTGLRALNARFTSLIKELLWLRVLIGFFLGTLLGIFLSPKYSGLEANTAKVIIAWIALPGHLFIALLQMIMIPLVFSSILLGINAGETLENLRKFGSRVLVYFVLTTAIAVVIGITLASITQPGRFLDKQGIPLVPNQSATTSSEPISLEKIPEIVISILPKNPFQTAFSGDMLGVVLLAMLVGIAVLSMKEEEARPVIHLLNAAFKTCMVIVEWAMKLAPYAVFGLIAQITAKIGIEVLVSLGAYFATVLGGLFLVIGMYSLILVFLAKKNPIWFFRKAADVQLLAFSTSSSAAVLPFTLKTAMEKMNVDKRIAEFIAPLGATINMDGTALYQAAATVFLSQVYGIELTFVQILFLLAATIVASIGTPSTPGVGIVILATILTGVGIPTEGIGIILGVDRLLDMCRTTVNITGDLVACNVFQTWEGKK